MEINKVYMPQTATEITETSNSYKAKLGNGTIVIVPKSINLEQSDVSWLIGFWVGDNWSSRNGTVKRNGRWSSGRFGIISNDEDIVHRCIRVMRKMNLQNIRLDVHFPSDAKIEEVQKQQFSKMFQIPYDRVLLYHGGNWRKNIGFAVYVNNTTITRFFNEIYSKLEIFLESGEINVSCFLKGLSDAEGDVDKANKRVNITTKDSYVENLIQMCLEKLDVAFTKQYDNGRIRFHMKDAESFKKKVGFLCERKRNALSEMISGNYFRSCDRAYFEKFLPDLRKGITTEELSQKHSIPYPTVKMVLRNLNSVKMVKKEKITWYGKCLYSVK